MRPQYLYYQLLKFSGEGTCAGDALDRSVDELCAAQCSELSDVPIAIRLSALLQICQVLLGKAPSEVQQRCSEVQRILPRRSNGVNMANLLGPVLGRAVEAAGVAYGIHHFIKEYRPFLDSRLYKTHGLNYLLANHGVKAIANVAYNIQRFTGYYLEYTKQEHGKLLGLASIKRICPDAYRVFVLREHECWQQGRTKGKAGARAMSMCLDQKTEAKGLDSPVTVPGRRSYSLDVRAGATELTLDAVAT